MDILHIENVFKKRQAEPMDISNKYAVLMPLVKVDEKLHVLFEVRSKKLGRQPSEISFPGGRVEKGETIKDAAIRETCEELNIEKSNITVLGELDFTTTANNVVYGFVGAVDNIDIDKIRYNEDEVDHIFTVPLDFFIKNEPDIHYMKLEIVTGEDFPYHLIPNGRAYDWDERGEKVCFYIYGDYIIWGMTAKFIKNFVEIFKCKCLR